jgi:hypothetical protein
MAQPPDPTTAQGCVFCGAPPPLTNEHVLAWWARSEEAGPKNTLYLRESGRATGEQWRHSRMGQPRDAQAKAVCAACNNGWMNDMDNALATLGPQLLRGRPVRLTKGKQASVAAWSAKTILMLQLIHRRQDRFVIPAPDYKQFYADKQPSESMRLWAGYMEPPGQRGGPGLAFVEYRSDERFYDESFLERLGTDRALTCRGYSALLRVGYLVIGLLKTESSALLPLHVLPAPRQWTEIWPAIGTKTWPPAAPLASAMGLSPFAVGLRPLAPARP